MVKCWALKCNVPGSIPAQGSWEITLNWEIFEILQLKNLSLNLPVAIFAGDETLCKIVCLNDVLDFEGVLPSFGLFSSSVGLLAGDPNFKNLKKNTRVLEIKFSVILPNN